MNIEKLFKKIIALPADEPVDCELISVGPVTLNKDNRPSYPLEVAFEDEDYSSTLHLVFNLTEGECWVSNGWNRITAILRINYEEGSGRMSSDS